MSANSQRSQTRQPLPEKSLLLGFAVQKKRPEGGIEISICWGRLFAAFLFVSAIAWISLTGTFYAYLKYAQGFQEITFGNTLLLQRSELRRKIGDHHIQESLAQIEAGNYNDAFRLLHFGVARSPGNLEGRKLIAEFYEIARQRPAIAADYMIDGLKHGGLDDIEYIKQLLRLLLRNQLDESILKIAAEHLPEEPVITNINCTLALGAANASYHRGNYDQAEDYLINYSLIESVEGLLIFSKISWGQGNHTAAISKLEQRINRYPDSDSLLVQLSRYHRQIGNTDKARRFAILRSVKDPLNYKPRVELLYIYNQENDVAREQSEIELIFEQFGQDRYAMIEFANFAANTGQVDLAKRIRTVALENGFDVDVFTLLLIEAHITDEDYEAVLALSENLIEQQAQWLTNQWAIFSSLRSVAAFAMSRPDLGEVYLQNFLKETGQKSQTYITVANHFLNIDRISQARKVLIFGYQQFPKNQKILSELIKAELELGNTEKLSELITKLLKMRRPQMELLARAYQKLGGDRFIFTENRDSLLLQLGAILRENNQGSTIIGEDYLAL